MHLPFDRWRGEKSSFAGIHGARINPLARASVESAAASLGRTSFGVDR